MPRKRKNTRLLWKYNDKKRKGKVREEFEEQILEDNEFDDQEKENEEDSEEENRYDFFTLAKASNWACNEQEDVVYDTEFVQIEGKDELSFASTSSSKISAEQ
ncbi:hypothetical protein Glove_19g336 [Diversispora epigaea]|uniref:Uncharacterized protein n=1 Tax=Diversispora epigaea TaxID=1348612 RepID=A0A397JVW1_9GLOM|nr:hypothetical protein Glove_19g336 [Diversispora epigaea]